MNTTTRKPSRTEFFAAQAVMTRNGWDHVLSAMDDVKNGTNFGFLYVKNGREFWMNYLTINNLPGE